MTETVVKGSSLCRDCEGPAKSYVYYALVGLGSVKRSPDIEHQLHCLPTVCLLGFFNLSYFFYQSHSKDITCELNEKA